MSKLKEIAEEIRGLCECTWTTGHESELFALADGIDEAKEELRTRLYEVLLQKALKGDPARPTAPVWHDAKEPPPPFESVLLFLPDYDSAVHEGCNTGSGEYLCYAWRTSCKPDKWRRMPAVPKEELC